MSYKIHCFIIISILLLICGNYVQGDCGKIPVIPFQWETPLPEPTEPEKLSHTVHRSETATPRIPDYGQDDETKRSQEETLQDAGSPPLNSDDDGSVPPPEPTGSVAAFGSSDKTFLEGQQQAIVAWNGYEDSRGEEMLILTTNEKSAKGNMPIAAISILPLPGRPVSVDRADARVFVKTKIMFEKKLVELQKAGGNIGKYGVIMTKKIGSHNIFVWKMDDIERFEDEINRYVAKVYRQNARALISDNALEIIRKYHLRGFRYFVFDLTLIDSKSRTKEAIAYRFKSRFAYYPLEISKIGGTGHTMVDLFVMTPGPIRLSGVIDENTDGFYVLGNTSVKFSRNEIDELEPGLNSVFESELHQLTVRNFIITGPINSFDGDFTAASW